MAQDPNTRLNRYHYVDADPTAPPGSLQRLRWEYVSARMDADEFRRRAILASPDSGLSKRDRAEFVERLRVAMRISRALARAQADPVSSPPYLAESA